MKKTADSVTGSPPGKKSPGTETAPPPGAQIDCRSVAILGPKPCRLRNRQGVCGLPRKCRQFRPVRVFSGPNFALFPRGRQIIPAQMAVNSAHDDVPHDRTPRLSAPLIIGICFKSFSRVGKTPSSRKKLVSRAPASPALCPTVAAFFSARTGTFPVVGSTKWMRSLADKSSLHQ